ncbi:aldehyde dehydrogenase [Saliphagus sp. GCM10025317]
MTELTSGEPAAYDMVIDGESVTSSSGERFEIEYPYTREVWATVPNGTAEDIDRAVAAARRCFESDEWQSLSATDRGKLLHDFADTIEEHSEELATLDTHGNGKLLREMQGQAEGLPDWFRYFAGLADKVHGKTIPIEQQRMFTFTRREPYGVVGAITPWNSPLTLALYKIAPAIAAGNTVVLKPSEVSPVSTIRLVELASEAGLPDGALNVVTGFGEPGAALTNHADVDKISFTGGLETGSKVAQTGGERIVPVTLELGGKSPNIVFEDADFDEAVTGAVKGIFAAAGQSCIAGSRLFLHEPIHDEFVDALVERAEAIELGDPIDPDIEMGPIAFEDQFEKIDQYVNIAREEGATVVTGGEPRDDLPGGLFYPPTVLTDVSNDMRIAQEEVFGPVLSVIPFEDESELVEMANDSEYGLAAGVWTNDLRRAMRMTEAIKAGVVWVNTYRKSSFTTPSGGYKKSGIGREKGVEGIEEYLQTKSVWIETEGEVSDPFKFI